MASTGAKAVLRAESLTRLQKAMKKIAEKTEIETTVIPTYNRDPELLQAQQLEALANWAEALEKTFAKPEVVDALDSEADTEPVKDTPKRAQKTTDDTPARAKSGSAKGTK